VETATIRVVTNAANVERAALDAQATIVEAAGTIRHMVMTKIGSSAMAKTATKQRKRSKHIPLRTCISCRETKPKRELLRVVRTPDGHVMIDATGKKSGRGAYLCARLSCWENAIKKKRLEQEFEQALAEEDRAGLEAFIATLPRDT